MKVPLTPDAREALRFQDYAPKPVIDGVFFQPLKVFRDINGSFMEYVRLTDGKIEGLGIDFEARQVSLSKAAPGRINAFHVHPKSIQDECWCVIDGALLVWLADIRDGSPTAGVRRPFVLTGEAPGLLHIPAGVAHGYKAGPAGAMLLYVMNEQFNIDDPNEGRLPWDHFGADLWEDDRG